MSEAYSDFAGVYDELMDNIPYDDWFSYLLDLFKSEGITGGIMCELGCGTGEMSERFSKSGYDMIGIDYSEEMLDIAQAKRAANESNTLYLCQDMREFELYGTVNGIYSICDSLNYITDPEDLLTVFKLANNYLDPKGVFIFDFRTRYYYQNEVSDSTIAESREDVSFIWDNYYDEDTNINELYLTLFIPEPELGEDIFRKHEEFHYQYGYTLSEIKMLIEKSGLIFEKAYDAFTKDEPGSESTRIYVIARENGK